MPLLSALRAEDYAYSRLLSYAAYQWPGYRDAPHHRLICRKLEAVERGEIKRLMIFMPPRHGKSMLASEFFPAWYLGRNPSHYVIAATYAQELADDFGRKVRNQIADESFTGIFPGVTIRSDSQSVKRFHVHEDAVTTTQAGAYFAVGVGGPLTGRGAHLLLIDDPVKNREDADSDISRRKAKEWYTSTAYTRLMPGGAVIIIQTRWHEDDLAGWLLADHAHEGWDVLELPALTDKGPLWPEQYGAEDLSRIRQAIGARDWSALYQQQPQPDEGTFFQRGWFKRYHPNELPTNLRKYGSSDYAVTDEGGDYTTHRVWGVDDQADLWLLSGGYRAQESSDKWIEAKLDLIERHRPFAWFGEAGVIQKAIAPALFRRMKERSVFCRMEWVPSIHDKPTRARGIQARAAMGKIHIPHGAEGDGILDEYLRFPSGKHDDDVDNGSLIGRALDMAHPAIVIPEKPKSVVPTGIMDATWDQMMAAQPLHKKRY